jgi:Rrf2 family protein
MKAKYALRALTRFVQVGQGEQLLSSDIAEREAIPKKFLESILCDLRHHGLLESRKGRHGGYRLRPGAEAASVASVVRMIDGPSAPVPCLNGSGRRCEDCPDQTRCAIQRVFREAHEATLKILENTTIADLALGTREHGGSSAARYSI